MAKRDALRALQSRLAERLQLAQDDTRKAQWLAVRCGGQGLLLGLADAGEIFSIGTLKPVPRTKAWFVGVANLRGALHGVVDLAGFLGLRPPVSAEQPGELARLVALNPSLGTQCALLVDALAGLRGAEQLQAEPTDAAAHPDFAGPRWRDAEGQVWQEIDLAALARHQRFLGISA